MATAARGKSQIIARDELRVNILEADTRRDFQQSRLVLQIRLSPNEVVALKQPDPLFVTVVRLSYLPILFPDLFQHFEEYIPPRLGRDYEIWFDVNSTPIPWQYPIGVLADMFSFSEGPHRRITVHFQNKPADMLPFSSIDSLGPLFMNSLRQSTYLFHASANPFMRLSKGAQATLWESVLTDDFASFSEAQSDLLWQSLDQCKSLAIRWHIIVGRAREVLLSPVPVFREDGVPRTIQDELNGTLSMAGEDVDVRTLGVIVPHDTPLYWICVHAAYFEIPKSACGIAHCMPASCGVDYLLCMISTARAGPDQHTTLIPTSQQFCRKVFPPTADVQRRENGWMCCGSNPTMGAGNKRMSTAR